MTTEATADTNPGVSLVHMGDSFKWALVDVNDYDVKKFGSDELTGKKGFALTVLTIDPGTAVKGNQTDGYEPISAGEVVTIYVSGYAKWDPNRDATTKPYVSWGAATAPFGKVGSAATVAEWCGLIGEWKFIEELKPSQPGISGRKDRKFRLRKAEAGEAHIVQQCHALLNGAPTDADEPEPAPF